jgi:hypothetical protein
MSAVLPIEWHVPARDPLPNLARSNQETFHGGGLPEEVAALVSVALGKRSARGRDPGVSG